MLRLIARLVSTHDKQTLEEALAWLYGFMRPLRLHLVGLLLLSLLASFLVLLQPWLTKLLIDNGLLAKNFSYLVVIAIAMVSVGVFSNLLSGLNKYLYTKYSGKILFSLRYDVYEHLLLLSPRFYETWRIGELFTRLDGDVAEIQRFAVDSLFAAITSIIGLIGACVLLVMLSWQLSLLVVVLLPLQLIWLRWMRKKVEVETRTLREKSSDLSAFLVETLPAVKFVQSAVQEQHEIKRLRHRGDSYLSQLLRLQIIEFFTQSIPTNLTTLMRAVAFIVGGYWVINDQWQLGALIAFGTYLGMVVGPAQSLLGLYVAVQRMTVSLHRVAELRNTAPLVQSPPQPTPLPNNQAADLSFTNIRFSHMGRRAGVLLTGDFSIKAGEKVLFQAPSGAGKSTLIDLIMRFYDPDEGSILFNGVDLKDASLANLRRRIAVVSQDIVLFRGSLADNLRYVNPDVSDQEILTVLAQVKLMRLVEALPNGIHTLLGERGQQLSGGQRQRLAIARALLQNPQILILDEATSAIDMKTEREILQVVDHLFAYCTRIYITHRDVSEQQTDKYLRIQDGVLLLS